MVDFKLPVELFPHLSMPNNNKIDFIINSISVVYNFLHLKTPCLAPVSFKINSIVYHH